MKKSGAETIPFPSVLWGLGPRDESNYRSTIIDWGSVKDSIDGLINPQEAGDRHQYDHAARPRH